MSVDYTKVNWKNSPSTQTPLNATNLNKMDTAIDNVSKWINENESKVGDESGLIAAPFSTTKAYSKGDLVVYEKQLYAAKNNVAAGAWNASNFETVTVSAKLTELKAAIDAIEPGGGGEGLSDAVKSALVQIAQKVAYTDGNGATYYQNLYDALYGTAVTHSVTYTLSNVTSSNTATTITDGSSFTTNLTADTDYTLDTVTVTMGGTDVTSSAYSNGTVTIASVTGDVVITASAVASGSDPVPVSLTATYTPVTGETITTATPHSHIKKRLTTTVTYSDNTTATLLPAQYELTGDFVTGTTTLTATYGELTASVSIPSVATSPYWKVVDIQEDMYDSVGLASSPTNTKSIAGYGVAIGAKTNSRVSYVDWDLLIDNDHTYTFEFDTNEGSTLQIGVPRYKDVPLRGAPADMGWINSGTVVNINADHENYNKAFRLTINDTLTNALAGGMSTIRITRTAVS